MKHESLGQLSVALLVAAASSAAVPRGASSVDGSVHVAEPASDAKTTKARLTDAQILCFSAVANGSEIEQATVAEPKARTDAVEKFAQLMIADHTAAKDRTLSIARDLNVELAPSAVSREVKRDGDTLVAELENARPENFDRTYLQGQVTLHDKLLKTIDELVPQARKGQVKELLVDMRKHVEHHLAVARTTLNGLD
jgi:putative membrane protein